MQRRIVDLPEPEAPISATDSCSATLEVDALQHLELAERLGDAAQLDDRGAHSPASRFRSHQSSSRASGIVTSRYISAAPSSGV